MSQSSKKMLIEAFANVIEEAREKGDHLLLLTPAGIITGIPYIPTDGISEKDGFQTVYHEITGMVSNGTATDTPGYILLSDAQLLKDRTPVNIGNIFLFYDQIIGVSIGTIVI